MAAPNLKLMDCKVRLKNDPTNRVYSLKNWYYDATKDICYYQIDAGTELLSKLEFTEDELIIVEEGTGAKENINKKMIIAINEMVTLLLRNQKILLDGGRLENEHWSDIAEILREHMQYFGNQDKYYM